MSNNRYDSTRQWYAIHTYSGYEEKVGDSIRQRINAVSVSGPDAETLFQAKKGVALRIRNVDYDKTHRPFAMADTLYHGGKYTMDVVI